MRLDDYLSTVGVIKRRTIAKQLADNGMIEVNSNKAKPSYIVKVNDIISIKGTKAVTLEVCAIPSGSVSKETRNRYFEIKS